MKPSGHPKLRRLEAFPVDHEGERAVVLRDPLGFSDRALLLPAAGYAICSLMDGARGIDEIQVAWARASGELIFREEILGLAGALDEAGFLDSPRFRARRASAFADFRAAPRRRAAHAGQAYPDDPAEAAAFVDGIIDSAKRPADAGAGPLLGLVAPHIDIRRGAAAYAETYAHLERAGGADLYVVLGTAHQGALLEESPELADERQLLEHHARGLYIATRKSFETPLGVVETDGGFIDRLEGRLGRRLDGAEMSHRSEHSIEFQALFIARVEERIARKRAGDARPARAPRMVPILCGSIEPWTSSGAAPDANADVAAALAALAAEIQAARTSGLRVLVIAAADLAHIGTKFGDKKPADEAACRACEAMDRASLEPVARGDAGGFFRAIAAEKDARNVCGVSCMYAMLRTLPGRGGNPPAAPPGQPLVGRVLSYGQAPDPPDAPASPPPEIRSMVSFCGVALHGGA